jgi:hypothetical protein
MRGRVRDWSEDPAFASLPAPDKNPERGEWVLSAQEMFLSVRSAAMR